MFGILLGLTLGLGLMSIWFACSQPLQPSVKIKAKTQTGMVTNLLAEAGFHDSQPKWLFLASIVMATISALIAFVSSGLSALAIIAASLGGVSPLLVLRAMARRRRRELRDLWPEVVDHIASGVRAGLSLPEALVEVGQKGPQQLRESFQEFSRDYNATADFSNSLDRLKARLSDPVADRLIEALRLTKEVGGNEVGKLLSTLSAFLREDNRIRAELQARQSWTINAARLAMIAPWVVLIMMSTRAAARNVYNSSLGYLIIFIGVLVSFVAYWTMLKIARLPQDERVLR